MNTSITKLSLLGLLAVALAGLPVCAGAKDVNAPAVEKKAAKAPKSGALPFHGKLKAVDKTEKTITVGKRTFQITADTKIVKADKPATLSDGVVGEDVSGAYKTESDGKLAATKITFGPKPKKAAAKKHKETAE